MPALVVRPTEPLESQPFAVPADKGSMSAFCEECTSVREAADLGKLDAARSPLPPESVHTNAADEAARQRALEVLGILDSPPEPEFDELVQLTAAICCSPVCLISFLEGQRQWIKAAHGLTMQQIPRDLSFCHFTIESSDLLLVEDTRTETRFPHQAEMAASQGWRFYAGVRLTSGEGHGVGTLCLLDRVPRALTPEQQAALRILAGQVNARLELRAQRHHLELTLAAAEAAKAQAESLERRFQTFMDYGPFLAYMKDAEGRMLYYNAPFAERFQVTRTEKLNKTDAELWPPALAEAYRKHDLEVLQADSLQLSIEETQNPDGTLSVWRSYKFPCPDASGHLLGGLSIEVTEELQREAELKRYQLELEAANKQLRELASVDPLTGLANRRVFDEEIRSAFHTARKANAPLSLLMIDVDHFKTHNDRFGHAHGDQVLRSLALRLRQEVRATDLLVRYGGEEFVLVLQNTSSGEATIIAQRLVSTVREARWPLAPVTISIGLGTLNPATRDAQHLVGRADEALYAAKCAGRNRVISYADEFSHLDLLLTQADPSRSCPTSGS